jgi:hypothetical protein
MHGRGERARCPHSPTPPLKPAPLLPPRHTRIAASRPAYAAAMPTHPMPAFSKETPTSVEYVPQQGVVVTRETWACGQVRERFAADTPPARQVATHTCSAVARAAASQE